MTETYEDLRLNFFSEYDRENPITQEQAVKEWIIF